jgi:UDP-glucose 4-epimerase
VGRVLLTGGLGFIGLRVADRLTARGHDIVIVDRAQTASCFRVCRVDIRDAEALARLLEVSCIDALIHLAAVHYLPWCRDHPAETVSINVGGTRAILAAVANSPIRHIVFSSSAAVYVPAMTAHCEDDPLGGDDVYGASKLVAENAVRGWASQHGITSTVARIFNVYGPFDRTPHVVPALVSQLAAGRPEVRLGNTLPRRDFIFVDDVAEAIVRTFELGVDGYVNVGTGTCHAVGDLVRAMAAIIGRELEIVDDSRQSRSVDRMHLCADVTTLRGLLPTFRPMDLIDGLSLTLQDEGIMQSPVSVRGRRLIGRRSVRSDVACGGCGHQR